MALPTHTVTLTTKLPGTDLPLDGTWSVSVHAGPPILKDTAGDVVFAGVHKVNTQDGVLELDLPATDSTDADPAGFKWKLQFRSSDNKYGLGPYVFDLTADATLVDIAAVTDIPITPSALQQAVQARDEAVAAAAAATAVGTTTDEVMAGRIEDPASQTHASLSATYVRGRGLDPAPLADATVTTRTGNVAPIDALADGLLYGHDATLNRLYSSADSGATWTQVNANLPTLISGAEGTGLRDVPGGEVLLMLRAGGVYRSTGWSTNKATATWSQVFACTSDAWVLPGGLDVQGDRVIVCEYAIPRTASRKMAVSTDGGQTFTLAKDLNVDYPANTADTHWHAVGIDPHVGSGRFWAAHGDGPNRLLYSDDGTTWTEFETGHQPMSITATAYGIILGSDAEPNGLAFIDRDTMTMRQVVTWRGGPSVIGFANKAITAPDGTVYVAFQSTVDSLPAPIIAASPDGQRGAIVYELPPAGATQPNLRNLMLDGNGKIIAPALLDGVNVDVAATPLGAGSVPFETLNQSGALVGNADATSVGIGFRANATTFGVALGKDASADTTDSGIAIGNGAVATLNQGIAIGKGALPTGTGGVAIGGSADATIGVAIGLNSYAETGVAIGNGASSAVGGVSLGNGAKSYVNSALAIGTGANTSTDTGRINMTVIGSGASALASHGTTIGAGASVGASASQGTAIGRNAQATGNASTAIGSSASSAHDNGVALGVGQATTTHAQLRLGPKHIELTEVTAPGTPAADAARLYVKDDGAGATGLYVKFSDGVERKVTTS